MNIWIILAIYWVVCCLAVYIIRNRDTFYNKKKIEIPGTYYNNLDYSARCSISAVVFYV